MSKRYTYDCVLTKQEDGFSVEFPQIQEAYTAGKTREEALKNAAEVLTLCLLDDYSGKATAPKYERTAEVVAVSVDISDQDEENSHYVTQAMAAEILGVSPSRISSLIARGRLDSKHIKGRNKVSIDSINRLNMTPRKAGRPAKVSVQK